MHTQITAAHMVVPPRIQSSRDLAGLVGCESSWIESHLGVRSRHVSQPGDDPAELAAQAAQPVIQQRGQPDLVIYASATVRQFLPDTSVFVLRQLGLSGVSCYSVHATCLSFLIALRQAVLSIRSGLHQRVLVVCAEMASFSRNLQQAESAGLLGDGAAAVMIELSDRPAGLKFFKQLTWPEHAELSQIRGGGLLRHPQWPTTTETDYQFEMDGDRLLRVTMPKLKKFLADMFQQLELTPADIDWVIPHQASASGMRLIERLGFSEERIVSIVENYGNCVAASMPMALALSQDKLKPGDRVLFLGSAAGLSLGAILWEW